ncbi:tRNA (adenosine(37)-N6)-dimethylallyltransferase MiaA [Priestia koreensis]|uniref:tRNA (adenosine(37)-N6)-dimethylallyltransferase MiaA n=1 Tax=Priestia koreensis TaxID=284581 RepID=UPI001F5808C3|nr:tRNA (adenosine(37)-N6)-dimethylallyltransferase MiaA [Priestia koreensis]MCM3003668.1 tRNA (adenosine(37)-N6)-dimethylallyltransferase MiaA [Priestia koreensis]UNL83777.1 tRNA (adenosine(37)-N6)-dimethylallyltransferase MiaA [Priestia koreensis]
MGEKQKLVVLIGPTAVGKTNLSISLAEALNGEIISGDSMQIYRQMDIGTAKIKREEMKGIPHHLLDIKDPDEAFSVADFQTIVREKISEIASRGKVPMIVGGTGLYIQSVIYDYQFAEKEENREIKQRLEALLDEKGIEYLYNKLKEVDPASAERIHINNHRRVMRALEVYEATGKPFSDNVSEQSYELLYDVTLIGLTMDRDKLYERINMRVDMMVDEGLLDEVKRLYDGGIRDVQSIQAIGYKEIYEYLDGHVTLEKAVEQLKQNSRRYAKRQLTWFRNKMPVTWFDVTGASQRELFDEIFTYVAGKLEQEANN